MTIAQSLAGLPAFLTYFFLSLALLVLFIAVYLAVTPYNELMLIRQGNVAAAISLGGAVIGFVMPLARAVTQSVSTLDLVTWGGVALVVQVVVFFLVGKLVPKLTNAVKDGKVAAATFLASLAAAVGLLNAASMTIS
jgi:putative membrane protein